MQGHHQCGTHASLLGKPGCTVARVPRLAFVCKMGTGEQLPSWLRHEILNLKHQVILLKVSLRAEMVWQQGVMQERLTPGTLRSPSKWTERETSRPPALSSPSGKAQKRLCFCGHSGTQKPEVPFL